MATQQPTLNIIQLVASLSETIDKSLRISLSNNNPAPKLKWNQNDIILAQIYFAVEDINSILQNVYYADGVNVGIGTSALVTGTLATLFGGSTVTAVTDSTGVHYDVLIDLRGVSLDNWLGSAPSLDVNFNIQISDAAGGSATERLTVALPTVTIFADLYNDGTVSDEALQPQFFSIISTLAAFIQNRIDITAETGGAAVAASYATSQGSNADLKFTAVNTGTGGNGISIAYVNPMADNAALGVVVTGNAIVVNLATGSGGAITSTAGAIAAALGASAPAMALVAVALASGSTGVGIVTAFSATNLTGGEGDAIDSISTTASFNPAIPGWKIEINDADSSRWRLDNNPGGAIATVAGVSVVPLDNADLVWTKYS